MCFFRDITEAVRAEKMRVDFVSNASHERRLSLAALMGFIETIKGSASNDQKVQRKFLDIMEREAHRMRCLINDLLSLSRVEANEHVRPRESVDIDAVLRGAVEILQAGAADLEKEIVLEILAAANTYGKAWTCILARAIA